LNPSRPAPSRALSFPGALAGGERRGNALVLHSPHTLNAVIGYDKGATIAKQAGMLLSEPMSR